MKYFAATDIGNTREKNEDSFYCMDDLFIVADGMGGHLAGEIASKYAIERFVENFKRNPVISESGKKDLDKPDTIKDLLTRSIESANQYVYENSVINPSYSGMGTTFSCCYINNGTAYIAHIGDSRIYLKRKNSFKMLTDDHTMVWELYLKGKISKEDAFDHPYRNYLTNVLGTEKKISFDLKTYRLEKDDMLLLCTDGLNSMIDDDGIYKILHKSDSPERYVKKLINSVLKKGARDNITLIVVIY